MSSFIYCVSVCISVLSPVSSLLAANEIPKWACSDFSHPSHCSHFCFLRCSENNSVSRKVNRALLLMAFNCIFSFPDVRPWQRGVKRNSGPSEKLFWHREGTCTLPNSLLLFSVHPAACLGPGKESLTVKFKVKNIKAEHCKGRSSSRMSWSSKWAFLPSVTANGEKQQFGYLIAIVFCL